MVLPANTMELDEAALVEYYVRLADAVDIPIMVQQSPHIMAYAGCALSVESLAEIARRAPNARYFKIEGPGSAQKIGALRALLGDSVGLVGGVGGLGLREEFEAGASGLLPGVGFNEIFLQAWAAWTSGDKAAVDPILTEANPLVRAVSGRGHEFSLHARKHLFQRAGLIDTAYVRWPTVSVSEADLQLVAELADGMALRITRPVADGTSN
jgi:4-hydroxy-tetrahydrodipicolinate synthase